MALAENGASNETIRLLETRSSVRSFTPDPVSEEMIVAVLEAARRAPTSSNMQAYSFVVVREEETRRKLSVLAGNQPFVAKAPVFVAVCADLSQIACVCEKYGKTLSGQSLDIGMRAVIDAALAGMTASLVAQSLGLGSVFIGGIRSDSVGAAQLLDLPRSAFVAFGLCLGWPAYRSAPKPRKPREAAIHFERYDPAKTLPALEAYDDVLAEYFRTITKPADAETIPGNDRPMFDGTSWSQSMAETFSSPGRTDLRAGLKQLGFDFD